MFNGGDAMNPYQENMPKAEFLVDVVYNHIVYCRARSRTDNVILMFGDDFAHP